MRPEDPNNLVRVLRSVSDDVPDAVIFQALHQRLRPCIAILVLTRQTCALVLNIGLCDHRIGMLTLHMLENVPGTNCRIAG